ncbi:peptidylprolyl isomerase [Effusibacillus lacus]|uniref:peptidylprolyl isomerase n=1 Tax=Effusibacillus lacus TaxID=1348429 RepID=A0A292YIF8_9BACL|nr:peptidylprolyl isomerase [Effusibacillus lacus]TCS74465.1 foldase protein PrsA [Effusibacillus lacus]GAX88661.1 hypothetical protein EFBL_0273 [Effusibacillus lacus]
MPRTSWKLLLATVAVSLGLAGCGSKAADTSGEVVATYNGGKVNQGEFQKQINIRKLFDPEFKEEQQNKKEFLEDYVLYGKVMVDKAKEANIKVEQNQVGPILNQYKGMITQIAYGGDNNRFQEQMKKLNLKDEDLKSWVEASIYAEEYQKQKMTPPDDLLKKFYEDNRGAFANATVHHILTKTREEAMQVKERLANGEDFAKVAKEVSIDPSAKENGGKMEGPLSRYVDPFRDAAMKLEINKISDPVQTEFGYHILKVEKRGEPEPFDKVKEEVSQLYFAKNQQTIEKDWNAHVEEMKKNADIKITLPTESK